MVGEGIDLSRDLRDGIAPPAARPSTPMQCRLLPELFTKHTGLLLMELDPNAMGKWP